MCPISSPGQDLQLRQWNSIKTTSGASPCWYEPARSAIEWSGHKDYDTSRLRLTLSLLLGASLESHLFYDLHSHILPGVDDGPKEIGSTLEMARIAADNGTAVMLATPHRKDITENSSVRQVKDLLAVVNSRIDEESIDLRMVLGMENHLDVDLPIEFSCGRALPMNGSRYILVEMPFFGKPNYIEDALFQMQLQGTVPVLAHPERIEAFQMDPGLLARFVERGMLSQITAGSVVGHFGSRARRFTHTILRRRLVHVIASDTHFPNGPRSPHLLPGVSAAARIVGEERARAMVVETPRAILDDQPVDVEPPTEAGPIRRWWWPLR